MKYILGLDGGGTKTVIAAADLNGKIIAEIEFGSTNFKGIGVENSKKNFIEGFLRLAGNLKSDSDNSEPFFESSCFGLAGLNTDCDRKIFYEIILNDTVKPFLNLDKVVLCNDSVIGLAAGTHKKNGIIIICGTGSNCYGINEEGMHAKTTGWDYILGDEGSGTSMGFKTLRAIMKAYDGRGPQTMLIKTVFEYIGINNIDELNSWVYDKPFSKDRFASLSLPLCNTAEMGDKVAINILKEEAKEVILSIKTVAKKLNLDSKDFDLVFVGKNFRCVKYFKKIIMKELKKLFPSINFTPLTNKPVEGAIKIAMRNFFGAYGHQ